MLTPDQIRLRLECVNVHESDFAVKQLLGILTEVLPEVAALSSGRTEHHTGDRFHTHGIDGLGPTEWTDDVALRQARADGYRRGWYVATARAESRFALGLPIEYGANVGLEPNEARSR